MKADTLDHLREDLGSYYLANHEDYQWVSFQQEEMAPALEAVASGDIKRLMILIPPGHSKSTLVSVDFRSWYIGKFPKHNTIGISYGADLAEGFSTEVRNRLRSPLHCELFPRSALSADSRGKKSFRTLAGGKHYALGFKGGIYGKRADGIIIDDPLKNIQEARHFSKDRYDFFKGIIKSRLRPGGWVVIVTTRLCIADFASRVLEAEAEAWTVIKLPAETNGKFLWEEFYPRKHYEDLKKDFRNWSALYMQDPESGYGGPWFQNIPMQFYDGELKPGVFPAYMICDPGLSKSKTGDPTSIMVLCATNERKLLLADWVLDRLDPDERALKLIALIRRWKPRCFVYEEYGLNADTHTLRNIFKENGIYLFPVPVGRKGPRHMLDKDARVQGLIADFKDGKIVFPRELYYRQVDGEVVELISKFKDEEYDIWAGEGSTIHDEGLDTLSRTHEPELGIRFPDEPAGAHGDDEEYVDGLSGGGSWESRLSWILVIMLSLCWGIA